MIDKLLRINLIANCLSQSQSPCTLTVLSPDLLSPAVSAEYAALGDLISC